MPRGSPRPFLRSAQIPDRAAFNTQPPGVGSQRLEQRGVGARHECLKPQAENFVKERTAAFLVEMRGNLVEQKKGRHVARGEKARIGEHDADKQRLLLAGRTGPRLAVPDHVTHKQIGAMRAFERAARACVTAARSGETGAVSILDIDGGGLRKSRLKRALKREPAPERPRRIEWPLRRASISTRAAAIATPCAAI